MPFKSLIIEYVTASEKEEYIQEHHRCGCEWKEDCDCEKCYIARKLSEAEEAPAYFRYLEYFENDWHPTNLSLKELLKDDDYQSCARIIVSHLNEFEPGKRDL